MGFSKKGFCMVIYGLRRPSFALFIAYKEPAGDLETVGWRHEQWMSLTPVGPDGAIIFRMVRRICSAK